MKKVKLFGIALLLVLGVLFLAQSRVAWANNLSGQDSQVENNEEQSVVAGQDNDNGDDDDEDEDDDDGTVKPPRKIVVIKKSGKYSIGGFCTMTVELKADDVMAVAYIERPLPRRLPEGVHAVRQGCRVTYYESKTRIDELTPELGSAKICFAATPKKEMTLYFYDVYAATPIWTALETKVEKGIACADGNGSGIYIATFKKK